MEEELNHEEQKELLRIARASIRARFDKAAPPEPSLKSTLLEEKRGAFVTLHSPDGNLRGCIGSFLSEKPLYITIREMALQAAFRDPRFQPLEEDELDGIHIEISALTPLKEITDVNEIAVGRHGLYITTGLRSGTLLPQVATEYGWDRDTFLEHTCMKAGLPSDAWKKGAKILTYTAQVFSEE